MKKIISSLIKPTINNLISQVQPRRYFAQLDGSTSYYDTVAPITFAGDFEIEVDVSLTDVTADQTIIGNSLDPRGFIRLAATNGMVDINFTVSGSSTEFNTPNIADGKFHNIRLTNTSGTLECFVDNISYGTATPSDISNINFDRIGNKTSNFFGGIIANVKFKDLATPPNSVSFKLDRPTGSTETSVEGNAVITYVNIPESDRELFILDLDGYWVGHELVVNGGFNTDSDWVKGVGWSINSGSAQLIGDGTPAEITQESVFIAGRNYSVAFSILDSNGAIGYSNDAGTMVDSTIDGSANSIWVADRTQLSFKRTTGTVSGRLDNVSVKRILETA